MGELVSSSDSDIAHVPRHCSLSSSYSESEDSDIAMPGNIRTRPRGPHRREIIEDSGASKHMIGIKQLHHSERCSVHKLAETFVGADGSRSGQM